MNDRKVAFLLMCGLVILWGMDYVFAKTALKVLEPMNLLFLKYLTGFFLLLALKLKLDRKNFVKLKDIPLFILCSVTGEILYFFCEYTAMDYIPVSLITIILSFVPAVSILTEKIIFKRNFSVKMAVGVLMCIIGVMIVIGADFKELLNGKLIGYILAFGAVISWNIYNFVTERMGNEYSGVTVTFTQLCCTALLIMPYALHTMPPIENFTPEVIGGIIYLGLGSAGIGFFITVNSLKVLGPTISAMFSNFLPVTATFFGWLFLGQVVGISQLVGGAIVIISSCVVITEKGKMEEKNNDREAEPDDAD